MPEYSRNQMHGKSFENIIKGSSGIFSSAAADRKRSPNERFDIGPGEDQALGLPTSVKSAKGNLVALSDARMFWQSFDYAPYRMLVGGYRQDDGDKVFQAIHEIILRKKYRGAMFGSVAESEISGFHDGLKGFGAGAEAAGRARAWAQQRKRELGPRLGLVALNPKIDTKNQRRLQCSVNLPGVIGMLEEGDYRLHREKFGVLRLPFSIVSGRRGFDRSR